MTRLQQVFSFAFDSKNTTFFQHAQKHSMNQIFANVTFFFLPFHYFSPTLVWRKRQRNEKNSQVLIWFSFLHFVSFFFFVCHFKDSFCFSTETFNVKQFTCQYYFACKRMTILMWNHRWLKTVFCCNFFRFQYVEKHEIFPNGSTSSCLFSRKK